MFYLTFIFFIFLTKNMKTDCTDWVGLLWHTLTIVKWFRFQMIYTVQIRFHSHSEKKIITVFINFKSSLFQVRFGPKLHIFLDLTSCWFHFVLNAFVLSFCWFHFVLCFCFPITKCQFWKTFTVHSFDILPPVNLVSFNIINYQPQFCYLCISSFLFG